MTARLKEDASASIGMATRLCPGRLKHVEIKHFALQHWVRQGRLTLEKVTTTEQLADIMTKPYSKQTLATLASVPMDVDALHREGGKGKKGKGKGKSKGDRNKHDGKGKGK